LRDRNPGYMSRVIPGTVPHIAVWDAIHEAAAAADMMWRS
jgi:hypothetical protein